MSERKISSYFCYVCNESLRVGKKCLSTLTTKCSKILIIKVLENLVGRILSNTPERNYCCMNCLNKINKYDLACMKMKQAQKVILDILIKTEENCNFTNSERSITSNIFENLTTRKIKLSCTEAVKEEKQLNCIEYKEGHLYTEYNHSIHCFSAPNNDKNELVPDVFIPKQLDIQNKISEEVGPVESISLLKSEEDCYERRHDKIELEAHENSKTLKAYKTSKKESVLYSSTKLRTRPPKRKTKCGACNVEFKNPNELREHRAKMHADTGKIFICHICGVEYKNQTALKTHIGLHNGESPFKCDTCGKLFTQKGTLRRHLPIHTGEKPYKCERCGKDFIHYSSFHMHTLAHDDYRDKKCDICGQLFRSTSHLNRHKLVHTGLKPHSCPTCGQTFAQRYNMVAHYKSHEGIRQRKRHSKCSKCGKGFFSAYKLQDHEVTCLVKQTQ